MSFFKARAYLFNSDGKKMKEVSQDVGGYFSYCSNHNCPIRDNCLRFTDNLCDAWYVTLFKPVRRRDGVVWCEMLKRKGSK